MAVLDSKKNEVQDDLVKLLCAMQSSLLFWCKHLLLATTSSKEEEKEEERCSMILKGAKDILLQCEKL